MLGELVDKRLRKAWRRFSLEKQQFEQECAEFEKQKQKLENEKQRLLHDVRSEHHTEFRERHEREIQHLKDGFKGLQKREKALKANAASKVDELLRDERATLAKERDALSESVEFHRTEIRNARTNSRKWHEDYKASERVRKAAKRALEDGNPTYALKLLSKPLKHSRR